MAKALDAKIFAIRDFGSLEAASKSFLRCRSESRSWAVEGKVGCHIGTLWKSAGAVPRSFLRTSTSRDQRVAALVRLPGLAEAARPGAPSFARDSASSG